MRPFPEILGQALGSLPRPFGITVCVANMRGDPPRPPLVAGVPSVAPRVVLYAMRHDTAILRPIPAITAPKGKGGGSRRVMDLDLLRYPCSLSPFFGDKPTASQTLFFFFPLYAFFRARTLNLMDLIRALPRTAPALFPPPLFPLPPSLAQPRDLLD